MNLTFQKIAADVTPLTLLSMFALFISIYGAVESPKNGHENYAAALYIIGLPAFLISLGLHFAIRWYFNKKVLSIWITETVLVVALIGFFYFKQ